MDYFHYKSGALHAEGVPVASIAEAVGTPFYCYSASSMEQNFKDFEIGLSDLPATICYAIKANSNLAVIKTLANMGAGADVVSSGELTRALKAGIPAKKIVFSGVGKTSSELAQAIKADILQINVESVAELETLNEIANNLSRKTQIALRVNPDIDAHTHEKISTGRSEDKFGLEWSKINKIYNYCLKFKNIEMTGLAIHIGSQLTELEPFRAAFARIKDIATKLRSNGCDISRIDLGGGLGISYDSTPAPSFGNYGKVAKDIFGNFDCELLFEPGRSIVGRSGILVTRVIHKKKGGNQNFVIIDAAMNDLIRPALYDAIHEIVPVLQKSQTKNIEEVSIVGPVCETGDTFMNKVKLPIINAQDLLAICSAGAYGSVMSSTYNSRPLIPEVMVKGDDFSIVRERITPDVYLNFEKLPDWIQ